MNIDNKYQETLDYIYSFIDFSLTRNLRYSEEKFDLRRMRVLMDLFGNPQHNYDVIHVAGTKGKGSTCAMISSILSSAGYRVGFYSSPHMIDFTERIKINNQNISKKEMIEYVDKMRDSISRVENVSTFEIATALAFEYFSKKEVDIAVIEVGMGGRLDATNVVDPILSVITPISLDHTKILGDTLTKIAREKAGIIKRGIPVVLSKQGPEVMSVLQNIAKRKESKAINVDKKYSWKSVDYSLDEQKFNLFSRTASENRNYINYEMALLGDHQLDNAATAYAVILNLPDSYRITPSTIKRGFEMVEWPGRFEVVSIEPLVIIDSAHNPDSFVKLSSTIEKYLHGKDITLIFGASEDKDVIKMIEVLQPQVKKIIFTKSKHPRAISESEFAEILIPKHFENIKFLEIENIAKSIVEETEGIFLAAGSIFIAGAFKELLRK